MNCLASKHNKFNSQNDRWIFLSLIDSFEIDLSCSKGGQIRVFRIDLETFFLFIFFS